MDKTASSIKICPLIEHSVRYKLVSLIFLVFYFKAPHVAEVSSAECGQDYVLFKERHTDRTKDLE